ncbi:hypothetical protein GCM10011344_11000 [Dokdonia pacifica]|uniref:Uncharacterized protein n=1 Tax=Dokdonia pacifica TaxID=1627892 RepID=A0A238YIB9_9FLAO|nr:hypothetical protein [Dokdonia pacifica]GGG12130.1 hypothetical protein GCM10011344_11000 [Dokdonia pacifica]SNR70877.1 hypothetical protein SAMN06265376_10296 [Dokdonia pacifica]
MRKKILLSIYLCLFSFSIIVSQNTNVKLRLSFRPGISASDAENIDIIISIIVGEEVISESFNRYPGFINRAVPNPQNERVFVEIDVLEPSEWTVKKKRIPYDRGNGTIQLRRRTDVYISRRDEAVKYKNRKQYSRAIEVYDEMLENKFYASESHKFEILRNKADVLNKYEKYEDAMQTYASIKDEVNLFEISDKKQKVLVNELYNTILKVGGYSKLKLPEEEFPTLIGSDTGIDLASWEAVTELYNNVYTNKVSPITNTAVIDGELIKSQFGIIGDTFNTFITRGQ